ncbi:N-acetylmuramoyl-L-alanine amidase-like domain-containing protein [Coleofasciculus sp. F4-SAH-05]|uniref:N-acetylmuramoyl-L-alanine amidase-like domain-containing protein n=1 Tax=Coleofasciculus sp. F4-SAH-05 TaxID=3069525 RepID=UPI003304ADBD
MRKMFGWAFVGLAISGGFTSDLAFQAQEYDSIPVSQAATRAEDTPGGGEVCKNAACYLWETEDEELIDYSYLSRDVENFSPTRTEALIFPPSQTLLTDTSNVTVSASMNPVSDEREQFQHVINWAIAQRLHEQPMTDIIQAIAHQFVGTPYKAGLLDQSSDETLVVTLQAFDCVLFVETVLAIARSLAQQDYSYPTFVNHLRDQRYQNGQLNGYCSRLHYFSAWIHDNEQRGTVANITQALGGISLNKRLNFMSTHRHRYPQLVNNQANYQCILEMEDQLNAVPLNYIPTDQIHHSYNRLQSGDIIGVATNIAGLDVTHTGFIDRQPDGRIRLIHASPAGEVTTSQDLQQYVGNIKHAIGILVIRPNDLR